MADATATNVVPADLADQLGGRSFNVVTEERLLALMHDTATLAEVGRAMALLSYIIMRCGESDQCVVNLHDAAREIGQPYSTVKTWLTALEHAGLVKKASQGRDGVKIVLDINRVNRMPVFKQIGESFQAAATILQAVQTTMTGVLAHAATGIRKWGQILSC